MSWTFRKRVKWWLYGYCPGLAGSFPYYGTRVYFPRGSVLFDIACEQGVFEHDNVVLICSLLQPGSVYFDVGANIGLMAIPALRSCSSCIVVSLEPSPNTLPYLRLTAAGSGYHDRWRIVGKAAAAAPGAQEFFTAAPDRGAFDGFRDTGRAGVGSTLAVPVTTIDEEWETLGRPAVSVIKIDVEGAETQVLQGASECISHEQPYLLVEWTAANLRAYSIPPEYLLELADRMDYGVFALPHIVPIECERTLALQLSRGESFLLIPGAGRRSRKEMDNPLGNARTP